MISLLKELTDDPQFPEGSAWIRHQFEAHRTVIREGEQGRSLYIIEKGELRISRRVELEDRRHIQPGICDLGRGEIFGEICLYGSHHLRTATVTTLTPARVLALDGHRLAVYLDARPLQGYLFLRALFERLASRINRANLRVDHLLAWGLKAHGIEAHL